MDTCCGPGVVFLGIFGVPGGIWVPLGRSGGLRVGFFEFLGSLGTPFWGPVGDIFDLLWRRFRSCFPGAPFQGFRVAFWSRGGAPGTPPDLKNHRFAL